MNNLNLEQVILLRVMEKRLRAMLAIGNPSRFNLPVIKRDLRWVRRERKLGRYHNNPITKPIDFRILTEPEYRAGRVDAYCRPVAKGSSIKLAQRIVAMGAAA